MMAKLKNDPKAVDAYLASLPKEERLALENLRRLIKNTLPAIEERISYGTTIMFSMGRDLVGLGAQKKHLSFYTASPQLASKLKSEITQTHQVNGATIHFSPEQPLPEVLVKKILQARFKELS